MDAIPSAPQLRQKYMRLLLMTATILSCMVGFLTIPQFFSSHAVHADSTLLSQNKPATASSLESAAFPASAAVDGNTGTRWSSAFSDPQWLQVDLGASSTITQVVLQWETAYGKAYQLQVSNDATNWNTIYSTTTGTGGTETLNVSGTGRYVRMYGTQRATQYGYSLWEFQVYGGAQSGCGTTNIAQNQPATTSSTESSAYPASAAIDGNTGTRWSSAWSDPQWLQVDLGSQQSICKVVLQWEAAYGKAYQLQVSNDASNWNTVYSTTTGAGGTETLNVSGSGRYIRMYGTQRATQYGYSLWEFQVFATGGSVPTPTPTFSGHTWNLIWSDEFNGASGTPPDPNKWTPDVGGGGWGNSQLEYDTNNQNAYQDGNGNLVIESRKENPANYQCWYGTCQYTSARITTNGHFSVTYGRIEARIKIPYGQGMWPAFWMLGSNINTGVSWPTCGEMDIMENIGKEPATIHGTVHGPGYSGSNGIGGPYTLSSGRFADDFHDFMIQWDTDHVYFFVDDTNYFTVNRSDVVANHGPWVYDHPFFIILNSAVGGAWPGNPDSTTTFPQKMLIDYVRVYQ